MKVGGLNKKFFVDSSSYALESLHKWGVPLCYPYSCCCPWSSMLRYFSFNAFLDLSDMISSAVCQWSLMLHYILNAISGSLGYDQAQIEFWTDTVLCSHVCSWEFRLRIFFWAEPCYDRSWMYEMRFPVLNPNWCMVNCRSRCYWSINDLWCAR